MRLTLLDRSDRADKLKAPDATLPPSHSLNLAPLFPQIPSHPPPLCFLSHVSLSSIPNVIISYTLTHTQTFLLSIYFLRSFLFLLLFFLCVFAIFPSACSPHCLIPTSVSALTERMAFVTTRCAPRSEGEQIAPQWSTKHRHSASSLFAMVFHSQHCSRVILSVFQSMKTGGKTKRKWVDVSCAENELSSASPLFQRKMCRHAFLPFNHCKN